MTAPKNERKTENVVRDELRRLGYYRKPVVVEEQGVIVEGGREGSFLPGRFVRIFGAIDVGLVGSKGEGGHIERAVMVAQAARPGPPAIGVLAV